MDSQLPNPKRALRVEWWIISAILALVIISMLAIWQPWRRLDPNARTVQVTGQATVQEVPDQFVFNPVYQFKNSNLQAALDELTKKSNDVVAQLKKLGVADKDIKTNSDGYAYPQYIDGSASPTYSLRITVTTTDKDIAQKVQNYLLTTAPTGQVSPQVSFSEQKRKQVETQARDQATKDARTKAERTAQNLGFSLGAVKSVDDGAGFSDGGIVPLNEDKRTSGTQSLTVQPGQNDLSYSLRVTYFVQ